VKPPLRNWPITATTRATLTAIRDDEARGALQRYVKASAYISWAIASSFTGSFNQSIHFSLMRLCRSSMRLPAPRRSEQSRSCSMTRTDPRTWTREPRTMPQIACVSLYVAALYPVNPEADTARAYARVRMRDGQRVDQGDRAEAGFHLG
jgi:hypothetical protein